MNATTDRSSEGNETRLSAALLGNVNLSMRDEEHMSEAVRVDAIGGSIMTLFAQSWNEPATNSTRFNIASANSESGQRQLSIVAISPTYQIQWSLEAAEVDFFAKIILVNIF